MTVRELIEKLQELPQEAEAYVATDCCGCYKPVGAIYKEENRERVIVQD